MHSFYSFLIIFLLNFLADAQQNLFNIPSGDITPQGRVFYQHQINAYTINNYESKSHFVIGVLKSKAEVGINIVNIPLQFQKSPTTTINDNINLYPLYPAILFTAQYKSKISSNFYSNIGTQTGFNYTSNKNNIKLLQFHYALLKYEPKPNYKFMVGTYYGNKYFIGKDELGLLAGYEIPLNKNFYLMGDFISGKNNNSVTVIGGMVNITKRIQICAGGLLPFPNSKNKYGFVLELNLLNYNLN
ncbi:MAG: hypothetical protein SFY56_09870 [Bacteroidota bacterium]|nr:hypothetical protein [Bacteroidota bacterium]